jgi:hypothetical protein
MDGINSSSVNALGIVWFVMMDKVIKKLKIRIENIYIIHCNTIMIMYSPLLRTEPVSDIFIYLEV